MMTTDEVIDSIYETVTRLVRLDHVQRKHLDRRALDAVDILLDQTTSTAEQMKRTLADLPAPDPSTAVSGIPAPGRGGRREPSSPLDRLGKTQASLMLSLIKHNGYWHKDCGWLWTTHARTTKILDSLAKRGWVAVTSNGKTTRYDLTDLGREVADMPELRAIATKP
jgi:hypothetical protein